MFVCNICLVDSGILSVPEVETVPSVERQRSVQEGPQCKESARGESILSEPGEISCCIRPEMWK